MNTVLPLQYSYKTFYNMAVFFITKTTYVNYTPISCFTPIEIENLLYCVTEFKNPLKRV